LFRLNENCFVDFIIQFGLVKNIFIIKCIFFIKLTKIINFICVKFRVENVFEYVLYILLSSNRPNYYILFKVTPSLPRNSRTYIGVIIWKSDIYPLNRWLKKRKICILFIFIIVKCICQEKLSNLWIFFAKHLKISVKM
jgi:hypothetical protein